MDPTDIGVTPGMSVRYRQLFKNVKKTNIVMGSGSVHRHKFSFIEGGKKIN